MPFNQPFRVGFEPGDIVYGLRGAREKYWNTFFIGLGNFLPFNPMQGGSTIDQYALSQTEIDYRAEHLPFFGVPDKNSEFQRFLGAHENEKYRSTLEMRPNFVQIKGSDIPGLEFSNQYLRRKCKAGLAWGALSNNNMHVHFLLDHINLHKVINKVNVAATNGRDVTGSELRWIYRNRDNINVKNRIQFWLDFNAVHPPWCVPPGGSSPDWSMYVPRAEAGSSVELSRLFNTP